MTSHPQTHILHTVAGLSVFGGGPSVSVPAICSHLRRLPYAWDVRILTTAGDGARPSVAVQETPVIALPPGQNAWQAYRTATEKIVALAPDLIHDHGQWLPINHASAVAAQRLDIQRIVSPRGMLSPWSRNHRRWKKQFAWWLYAGRDLRNATLLHATSELERDELRELGCRHPIAVIPNGVYLSEELNSPKRTPPYVLSMSRIHPKKGIKELLDVWDRLRLPDWELLIAGPDPLGLVDKYQIASRRSVRYLGMVQGAEKLKLMSEASLFVLPSYSENFGIAVAEALMAGTPVITTRGTPWRIVEQTACGWWIEMNEESLESTLRNATQQSQARLGEMGRVGREVVSTHFSWPTIAESMGQVYRWLLEGGAPPSTVSIL